MWQPTLLTPEQIRRCENTISPNTFHMICGDAILRHKPLSVVRFGEGELKIIKCLEQGISVQDHFPDDWRVDWKDRVGIKDIPDGELKSRLYKALNNCDYFSPFISGITDENFDLYYLRQEQRYLDNFFINFWNEKQKVELYKAAGHVLLLHRNPDTANAFIRRAHQFLGVKVTYFHLSNWTHSDDVIRQCNGIDAPLVLFSGGPASKYISPEIAKSGKVVLDVGNSVDEFILWETEQNSKK